MDKCKVRHIKAQYSPTTTNLLGGPDIGCSFFVQREAQHWGGGGRDDGANPHPNLRLEYKTIYFDILGMSVSQKMTKLQYIFKMH